MRAAAAALALALAAVVSAQDQMIEVGATATTDGGIFQFIPNNITATEGSVITFNFTGAPGNHTVAQSTFASPCQPASGGFDSGYIFVPAGTTEFPTWNLTITNGSQPIWFYCAQRVGAAAVGGPHCFAGMVGSINAPATGNTFATFQSAAENAVTANATLLPGVPTPALSGNGAQATSAPGPLSGSVAGFGVPSGTAAAPSVTAPAAGSSSGSAAGSSGSPAPTSSGALAVAFNAGFVVLSAIAGAYLL